MSENQNHALSDCPWWDEPAYKRPAWMRGDCGGRMIDDAVGVVCENHFNAADPSRIHSVNREAMSKQEAAALISGVGCVNGWRTLAEGIVRGREDHIEWSAIPRHVDWSGYDRETGEGARWSCLVGHMYGALGVSMDVFAGEANESGPGLVAEDVGADLDPVSWRFLSMLQTLQDEHNEWGYALDGANWVIEQPEAMEFGVFLPAVWRHRWDAHVEKNYDEYVASKSNR